MKIPEKEKAPFYIKYIMQGLLNLDHGYMLQFNTLPLKSMFIFF